jgi:hypothetical protein
MAQEEPFRPVSVHAVRVLARLATKRAIEAEIKDQGVHPWLVRLSEINDRARVYLAQHPELLEQAEEKARLLGLFEHPRGRGLGHSCPSDLPDRQKAANQPLMRFEFSVADLVGSQALDD